MYAHTQVKDHIHAIIVHTDLLTVAVLWSIDGDTTQQLQPEDSWVLWENWKSAILWHTPHQNSVILYFLYLMDRRHRSYQLLLVAKYSTVYRKEWYWPRYPNDKIPVYLLAGWLCGGYRNGSRPYSAQLTGHRGNRALYIFMRGWSTSSWSIKKDMVWNTLWNSSSLI